MELTNERFPLTMWESNDRTPNVLCGTCMWIYSAKNWQDLALTAIRHKLNHIKESE